jgi:2-isopropylmalate synthase
MTDYISASLRKGKLVFWEEIARTLLNAAQRIEIAKLQSQIFGNSGSNHLIFAAGFPGICKAEFEIIRQMASEVDTCYLATHGRALREEIDLGIAALEGAKFGRITFFFPVNEQMCNHLMHKSTSETAKNGIDLAKYALDKAKGLPVDIALAGIAGADPIFVADVVSRLSAEGVSLVKLCDSAGRLFPLEIKAFFETLIQKKEKNALIGTHFHNDLGFALANTLETLKLGINVVAGSWLGLAERTGLIPTELFLFLMINETEKLADRLGLDARHFFTEKPNLSKLAKIARKVSQYTGVPLKATDLITGPSINSFSTGTPFNSPADFLAFRPENIGIEPSILVTHLSSHKVILEFMEKIGYQLTELEVKHLFSMVKTWPYENNQSIVPKEMLVKWMEEYRKSI